MPLDLLIQHRTLKVMHSYRYYNYTDGHSILLKPPIVAICSLSHLYHMHGLYLFMVTFFPCHLSFTKKFFIHQPHPESIVVSCQVVVILI